MFTCNPDTVDVSVEQVQLAQVRQKGITFADWMRVSRIDSTVQIVGYATEQPGLSLRCSANHDSISLGIFQHSLRFLWRINVTVGDDGDSYFPFYLLDGLIFDWTMKFALPSTTVY